MRQLMGAALGLVSVAMVFAAPAFADPMKDGSLTLIMPNGDMQSMSVDKDKVAEMIKMATPMSDEMAIFAWGGKFYLLHNEKMKNGQMSFDYWGFHGTR